jgi:hypothetical protein
MLGARAPAHVAPQAPAAHARVLRREACRQVARATRAHTVRCAAGGAGDGAIGREVLSASQRAKLDPCVRAHAALLHLPSGALTRPRCAARATASSTRRRAS